MVGGALRALLVQSAKKLLRVNNPLQKWGLAVATRRGRNKAAVAVARKLCVAVWHVMQGHVIDRMGPCINSSNVINKYAVDFLMKKIKSQGYETKEAFVQKKLFVLRS